MNYLQYFVYLLILIRQTPGFDDMRSEWKSAVKWPSWKLVVSTFQSLFSFKVLDVWGTRPWLFLWAVLTAVKIGQQKRHKLLRHPCGLVLIPFWPPNTLWPQWRLHTLWSSVSYVITIYLWGFYEDYIRCLGDKKKVFNKQKWLSLYISIPRVSKPHCIFFQQITS